MGKMYNRVAQRAIGAGNYLMGYRTPERLEGPGCVTQLPARIKQQHVKRVLLVTGPNIRKLGLADDLLKGLKREGIAVSVFSDVHENPTDADVEAGFNLFKTEGCKGIIAFGGGSPMDCAKAIAARNARPEKTVEDLQGLLKIRKKTCPLWAVPTTAGTGSEATLAAVITIQETRHKASINDPALMPCLAVLDPELTRSVPPRVTAATGMDALCHAVESYTNWVYCTDLEKDYARKAVKLIYDNLLDAYEDGSNLEARQNMQLAAFYAGRSFTRGCVGYVHACGHPLSSLYHLPHGLVMGVALPHVMRQFGPAVYTRLAELADVCGMEGETEQEKAEAFINWIAGLNGRMGLPAGFREIRRKDIPQMIRWAKAEAHPLYPTPVVWRTSDFRKLYETLSLGMQHHPGRLAGRGRARKAHKARR